MPLPMLAGWCKCCTIKILFALLSLIFVAQLLANDPKPNLDDLATRGKIMAQAIDEHELQKRGEEAAQLYYAPNSQKPYTGWVKQMGENGQVKNLYQLKDGKEHGLVTGWYENGQKGMEANFMNGMPHGLLEMWYEDGQKRMEGNKVEGQFHGLGTEWDEDGNVISQTNFENGKEVEEVK